MSQISDLKEKCEYAAIRTEKWMLSHLLEERIVQKDIPDPVSYYKWPLTLFARGKISEASELFKWVMEKSLSGNGDLLSDRSGFHKEFHVYANLWLIMAAIQLEETEITEKLLRFLMKYQNQK